MVKVSDIIVGPVKAWASYTAVDPVFDVSYADKTIPSSLSTPVGQLLKSKLRSRSR